MSSNHGKGDAPAADDRTLLDPLDADELRALREARQRLQGAPASSPSVSDDDDVGATRAMSAIPSFETPGTSSGGSGGGSGTQGVGGFMAAPKPLSVGQVRVSSADAPAEAAATLLDAKATTGRGAAPAAGSGGSAPANPSGPPPNAQGFGENTLMWMEPVKAPENEIIPERGRAAAAGMTPTAAPAESSGRRAIAGVVVVLAALVIGYIVVSFLMPKAEPVAYELVTNPPKATVLIDGKETSVKTPMKARLPPGSHTLEIRLDGYKTETVTLEVTEGAAQERKSFELYPLSKPGLLTVSFEIAPVAANLTIDGKVYEARRTVRIADVDPSKAHKFEIEAGGYEKFTVEVPAGKLQPLYSHTLQPVKSP